MIIIKGKSVKTESQLNEARVGEDRQTTAGILTGFDLILPLEPDAS